MGNEGEAQQRQLNEENIPSAVDTSDVAEDDWQVVEEETSDSDDSSSFIAGPELAARPLFSNSKRGETECDGRRCKWKRLHHEMQAELKTVLEDMMAGLDESEKVLSVLDEKACALERTPCRSKWGRS